MEEVEGRDEDKNKIGKLKKKSKQAKKCGHTVCGDVTRRKVNQTHNVTCTGQGLRCKGNNKYAVCVSVTMNRFL